MINIALLGFGVVGSGTAEVLTQNKAIIEKKIGQAINIKYILDLRDFPDSPFADRIVHVHVKDYLVTSGNSRGKAADEYTSKGGNYLRGCLIGEGSVHTEAAFQALQAIGYSGFVSLEGDPIGPDEEVSFQKNMETVTAYMARYL